MIIKIRQGGNHRWLDMGDRYTKIDPEKSNACKIGSSERISVGDALRLYGATYAAYVAAVHYIYGANAPVYHAWRGVLNALGHTGEHMPPCKIFPSGEPFNTGKYIYNLPVVAEIEI